MRRLTDGDTAAEVLAEFLGLLDDFDFELKVLYVDSEFYDDKYFWRWPFEEFIRMITRAAWNALSVQRSILANQPPDDRFER